MNRPFFLTLAFNLFSSTFNFWGAKRNAIFCLALHRRPSPHELTRFRKSAESFAASIYDPPSHLLPSDYNFLHRGDLISLVAPSLSPSVNSGSCRRKSKNITSLNPHQFLTKLHSAQVGTVIRSHACGWSTKVS